MLRRDLYRGQSVYGKTRWEYRKGGKHKVAIPEKEWVRHTVPHLRIVSDDLWKRVQDRLAVTRETYPGRHSSGRLQGRREAGLVSKNLLSGFLRCGVCGGNMFVTARSGRGGVKKYYLCTTAHTRGSTACPNTKGVPYEALTEAVVAEFKGNFCNPVTLGNILMAELKQQTEAPDAAKEEAESVRKSLAGIERELGRLLEAVLAGAGDVQTLADAMKAKEREKSVLQAKLEHLDGLQQAAEGFDLAEWFKETSELLAGTKEYLEADTEQGRRLLRRCLMSPITVKLDPEGGWTFEADGRFMPSDLNRLLRPETEENPHAEQRRVQGRISADLNPPPTKLVPPG